MVTLRVSTRRVACHAGERGSLMLQRLCGMHGRVVNVEGMGSLLVINDLSADQVKGITGLLQSWGVPATAMEVMR